MKTLVSVVTPTYVVELGRLLTEAIELEGDWTGRFHNSHDANLKACGVLKVELAGAQPLVEIETAPASNVFVPVEVKEEVVPTAEIKEEVVPAAEIKEDDIPVVVETAEGTPVEVETPVKTKK